MGMRPYSPGKPIDEVKRELGLSDVIKLASNENPIGPSPKAVEAIKQAASGINIYPDAAAHDLREAIAKKHGVSPDQVVVGNGSDELIHYLGLVLLEGDETELVMGDPSFVRYIASAQLSDARLTKVPLDNTWTHDIPAMIGACTDKTRLIYLANPNNPTGTVVGKTGVEQLIDDTPEDALLVLDEAYYEFGTEHPDFPDSVELLKQGKPICILRTLSKAYGLAGIRVGYGIAPVEVIDAINRIREPFNVNVLAQAAAIAALDDQEHLDHTVRLNREGITRVEEKCRAMGLKTVQSYANFICIDCNRPGEEVFNELVKRGVIVRSGHVLGMPTHIRVTIGTENEMTQFLNAFETVMAVTA
jgi:histidinol-phosphate aminotransferase